MESVKNAIEIRNVTKDYGDFKLDSITFDVPEGSVCGFIGQNGAGKTTTIKLLLDVRAKDAGEIYVFGRDMSKESAAVREDIGVVFDEMGFNEYLTAKDINIIMRNIYKNWDEKTFFDYLKRFALPSKKKCGDFSRGMRMKLQIAVALSHNAKLLVMDEPTSGLDPIVRHEILEIFREFVLEENHTILLSTHITSDLEQIADEIVFINAGKIVLKGYKDELIEKHGILRCKKDERSMISDSLIVSEEDNSFGIQLLVNDRVACEKLYPKCVIRGEDKTMRGLIIKDMMSFRKRLVMVVFVTVAVVILAVMFSISARTGNLYDMIVPGPDTTEQEAATARDVFSYVFMMLMLLPMSAVGDTVKNMLFEDRLSGFTSVASVTPLTIGQRILSKIICFCGLYLAGAVLSIVISSLVSLFTDLVTFRQLFSIVIIGLSVCLIYTFLLF